MLAHACIIGSDCLMYSWGHKFLLFTGLLPGCTIWIWSGNSGIRIVIGLASPGFSNDKYMAILHLFSNAFEQCAFHLDNIAKRRHWAIALDTSQVARNIRLNAWNNLQNPNNLQWFRQISNFVVNNVHSSKTFTIEKTMCKCFRQCAECETNNHNPLEQWCKT